MATLVVAAGAVLGVAAPASAAPADTIYSLVNQARAAQGLRGLIRNPAIDGVAVNWANQMGASGSMTHNPSYSSQIPGGWTGAGENVAMGYPSAEAMFNGWMNSPGHRANILGDFTDIGIAFVTVNGSTWGVQDFGKYPGHVGAAPPAAAPPPAPAPAPKPAPVVPQPVPVATSAAPTPAPTPSAEPSSPASARATAERPERARLDAASRPGTAIDSAMWPALALVAGVALVAGALRLTLRRGRRPSA